MSTTEQNIFFFHGVEEIRFAVTEIENIEIERERERALRSWHRH
jgi:hypothetical protein